jgi:hypothetical protein
MLLASVILKGLIDLQAKRRRFEIGLARADGPVLPPREAVDVLAGEFDALLRIVDAIDRLMGSYLQRALGDPGVAGDADMIVSAGDALIEMYESLLDWADRVRSYNVPSALNEVADLEARHAESPIAEFEDFAKTLLSVASDLPRLASQPRDEPLVITVKWEPKLSRSLRRNHEKALKRAVRQLRI